MIKDPEKFFTTVIIIAFIIAIFSCGNNAEDRIETKTAVDEKPIDPENGICFSETEYRGMKLFMRHCNKCHPGGEKGKGPALNDKKLPDFAIHFQVRTGMGDMPSFKKDEISKEDVKRIIEFVQLMRRIKGN